MRVRNGSRKSNSWLVETTFDLKWFKEPLDDNSQQLSKPGAQTPTTDEAVGTGYIFSKLSGIDDTTVQPHCRFIYYRDFFIYRAPLPLRRDPKNWIQR